MDLMFCSASSFNQPIGNWNVSKVTSMESMFDGSWRFNQNINNWDVSKVTNMFFMFKAAKSFKQPLNNWNTGNVTNMGGMFKFCDSFNHNISTWNTGNVTNMGDMFDNAFLFNQNIGSWNTSSVTNMSGMFYNASSFNQNISKWNTSNVTTMSSMFYVAQFFNQNISSWDIGKCTGNIDFNGTGLQFDNYDSIIMSWTSQNVNNIYLTAYGLHYCNSASQRSNAIANKGWQFYYDSYGCTLPTSLSSFTVTEFQSNILLQWQTATETNTSHFNIQYSINGKNFETIGTKVANNKPSNYSFTHNLNISNTQYNTVYYRLQIVDKDGSISFSEIKSVSIKPSTSIIIYPNPANDFVNILGNGIQQIIITDISGKELFKKTTNHSAKETINIANLNSGIYFIETISNGNKTVQKIIKQ
jgi:surface protein